jgi:hypothetical protein
MVSKEDCEREGKIFVGWWVEHNGKRVDGRTKTVSEAKYEVERRMRD